MKYFISFLFFICLISCGKKKSNINDIELIIINDSFYSCDYKSETDSINIIQYSLKNNSNNIYFINNITSLESLSLNCIKKNGVYMAIYDQNQIEAGYIFNLSKTNFCSDSINLKYMESIDFEAEKLGYNHTIEYFKRTSKDELIFIHPHETIYFECFINISKPVKFNGNRQKFAMLDKNKKYNVVLKIASDSTNYKMVLPRNILKSIKTNNAVVFHGIIQSKNKIPLIVKEIKNPQ
jgi:hypothetical protein